MTYRNIRARGRRRVPGEMNSTERKYAHHLDALKLEGSVLEYWFERIKLKLADRTHYTPDFLVLHANGELVLHEVKGYWEDDARVKFKMAEELFPFGVIAAKWVKGAWEIETLR